MASIGSSISPDSSGSSSVSTGAVENVTISLADTEQSHSFPANTKCFMLKPRGTGKLKLSMSSGQSGTTYWTVPAGTYYSSPMLSTSPTIYFQSPTAGLVLELFSWS